MNQPHTHSACYNRPWNSTFHRAGFYPPAKGFFLYRLYVTSKFGNSRVACSHTRPLRGKTCRPVLCRVLRRPAAYLPQQHSGSRINDLQSEFLRTVAMGILLACSTTQSRVAYRRIASLTIGGGFYV